MFQLFVTNRLLSSCFSRKLFLVKKQKCLLSTTYKLLAKKTSSRKNDPGLNNIEIEATEQHALLMQQYQLKVLDSQQVLVIQPYYHSSSPNARQFTNEDFMMSETLGLVKTLGWKVVDGIILTIQKDDDQSKILGVGQLERIRDNITELESKKGLFISSVFVSTYKLSARSRLIAEEILGKTVIDRYSVILQIFQKHAQTREAKLQVRLAEIPYLKARLFSDLDLENESKHSKQRRGREWFDKQRLALNKREKSIKSDLDKVKSQRALLRSSRVRNKIPSVAVIGYTNAGKTSLIKAITGTEKLEPKDELFATLDVTSHPTVLPSQLESVMLDTVGFISDIPTSLIASFNATLEDASLADLLIHVRDVSNPDHLSQNKHVLQTLQNLEIPEKSIQSMITIGNKSDLVKEDDWKFIRDDGMIPISTKTGSNMEELLTKIDSFLIKETNRVQAVFKVPTGSNEFQTILQNTSVTQVEVCPEDPNLSLIKAIVLDYQLDQYQTWIHE